MTRFVCSPKTFLKVMSAFGSRYFAMSFDSVPVHGHSAPEENISNQSESLQNYKRERIANALNFQAAYLNRTVKPRSVYLAL